MIATMQYLTTKNTTAVTVKKIVAGCKSKEFCKHSLSVGDIIKCRDKDDAVSTSMELAMHGVHTDFKYELCGEHGLWLEITEIEEDK